MAWMAAHVFVRCDDQDRVAGALAELLRRGEHATSHEGIEDLPEPLVVSPALEGWIAASNARAWFDELPWVAAELSKACAARAVSCELVGVSYALRLAEHEAGQERSRVATPSGAWTGATEEPALMPRYEDAERVAWRELGRCGVPQTLIAIGTSPFGRPVGSARPLGQGVTLLRRGGEVERGEREVRAVPFSGDDPPVVPTSSGTDFGITLFEDRYVEGRPDTETLDNLLAVEEELLSRARRARPDAQVSLTVTYHAGLHQDVLDDALKRRGRPTAEFKERDSRAPWWAFWRYFGRVR